MAGSKLRVSVIIPVYRQWDTVRLTLDALERQTMNSTQFEVIVVDNGPRPTAHPPSDVRICHEPRGYSYAARNAGAAIARADVFAFTDADCVPTEDWLVNGMAALQTSGAGIVGGGIEITPSPRTWMGRYDAAFGFAPEYRFYDHGAFATANMFVCRGAFEQLGGFDARLQSAGDNKLCWRAAKEGIALHYAAAAVVQHPPREGLGDVLRKNRRCAAGMADVLRLAGYSSEPDSFWSRSSLRRFPRGLSGIRAIASGNDERVQGRVNERLVLACIHGGLKAHYTFSMRRAFRELTRDKDMH